MTSSTTAYLLVNLHKHYVEKSDSYQTAEWWRESETSFMHDLLDLCERIDEAITRLVCFDDYDGVFDYDVIDDDTDVMNALKRLVLENGPGCVSAEDWVKAMVELTPGLTLK